MRNALVTSLPWILSVLTIISMWLAGDQKKSRHGWGLAIANQILWLVYIIAAAAWGLLPMNIALWVVYIRNFRKR